MKNDGVLHPYSNARALEKEKRLIITEGDGIYVIDSEGRRYIEGVSSLWYANLGFSEKRLADAATRQLNRLPCYHAFSNRITDVVLELTERLLGMAPVPMSSVFYASSGSEANDTALKIVEYYYNAIGKPDKKLIIGRKMGYHGVTHAAASMTGVPRNHMGFDLPSSRVLHVSQPDFYKFGKIGETEEEYSGRLAEELENAIIQAGPERIGAFIAEPLMGVGGVVPPPAGYFQKVQKILDEHEILFIVDEVICGFGRLGEMFGTTAYDLKPDMITIAKGFSCGYVPISALMMNSKVYEAVADGTDKNGVFGHGFTYSAHPVAAAVALEALNIYEELDITKRVQELGDYFQTKLEDLRKSPIVGDIRGRGLIAGIQVVKNSETKEFFEPSQGAGKIFEINTERHGLITRALGDVLALAPPLIINKDEIDDFICRLSLALVDTEKELC
ncbi:aminotransferase [Halomonas salipaludis]|uniref:Aspartate aminotransferase family protein n=1 Tax=Halomonas salipaludis TaxID=2032625 RepID=A0A2A2EWV9_9GAMM|nr:aminotransferase [Halomonas salipaludis]PAU76859.1 aspartate aminotransferase family protein [Halomonas salipaludis]